MTVAYIELYSKRDGWLTERDPHFDRRLRLDIGYLELKHVEPLCFKYLGFWYLLVVIYLLVCLLEGKKL